MDTFSLLKYWRGGGGSAGDAAIGGNSSASVTTTAALSATDTVTDDDGPFFDLEISGEEEEEDEEAAESASSTTDSNSGDLNLSLSPSNDLFFKGRLLPIVEPLLAGSGDRKLVTKFQVFMRGLKKVKPPLYFRRYGQKGSPEAAEAIIGVNVKMQKKGTLREEVSKHLLRKSRSASSATVAAAPSSSRRDDSLMELHDGIQGAIQHCKRSFNLNTSSGLESSV